MKMPPLRYLTVQDVVWINLLVTGSPQKFRYLDLEEVTNYQYGYGTSTDLLAQAARFLVGFLRKKPLADGNEATAFLALFAFLRINGKELALRDVEAADWIRALPDSDDPRAKLEKAVRDAEEPEAISLEEAVEAALTRYVRTLAKLGCRSSLCDPERATALAS